MSALAWPSHAGRPLATDDGATAPAGQCQLENWIERQGSDGAWVAAPACSPAAGLEVDVDYTLPHPPDPVRAAAGIALKWVPAAAHLASSAGDLDFGLKGALGYERAAVAGWHTAERSLLGLLTWTPNPRWSVHLNLGIADAPAVRERARLFNVAAAWTPDPRWLLFAEALANDRRMVSGGTVRNVGARYWVVPDRLGLDLTASRMIGSPDTMWSLGFGWYGLFAD